MFPPRVVFKPSSLLSLKKLAWIAFDVLGIYFLWLLVLAVLEELILTGKEKKKKAYLACAKVDKFSSQLAPMLCPIYYTIWLEAKHIGDHKRVGLD